MVKFLACLGLFTVLQIPIFLVEESVIDNDKWRTSVSGICIFYSAIISILLVIFIL